MQLMFRSKSSITFTHTQLISWIRLGEPEFSKPADAHQALYRDGGRTDNEGGDEAKHDA